MHHMCFERSLHEQVEAFYMGNTTATVDVLSDITDVETVTDHIHGIIANLQRKDLTPQADDTVIDKVALKPSISLLCNCTSIIHIFI